MAQKQLIKMLLAKLDQIGRALTECELYAGLFAAKELQQTFIELRKANAELREHVKTGELPPTLVDAGRR